MVRILLIVPDSSYRTAAFSRAAEKLKFEYTIASTGGVHSPIEGGIGIALRSLQPAEMLAVILEQHKRTPFDGVIGTDDSTVGLAAKVAAHLNLRGNSAESVRAATRKDVSRRVLAESGMPVPGHRLVTLGGEGKYDLGDVSYPCICKPTELSASRGVIRADSPIELKNAMKRIQRILMEERAEPNPTVLVEDYIPGQEVAVEGLLYDGELALLAVFDKPDELEGPYFEETAYVTPSRHPKSVLLSVQESLATACTRLGLRWGPIHAECRLNESGVWIIEIACRSIGGRCGKLLEFSTGQSLEQIILTNAVGGRSDYSLIVEAAGVMMIPVPGKGGVLRRVEGIGMAARTPLVSSVEIDVRPGQMLVPWPEGCPYPGFIFAAGKDPESVEKALRSAHQKLDFVLAPMLPLKVSNV